MPHALSPERAEILGLEALAWLAAGPDALARFLAASGISGDDLRAAAGTPGLTVAVLDFLLAHEDLLMSFCETTGTSTGLLHQARRRLEPEA
ncbi:MAG TPA: DUF3572 domain-containing protein [Rhizomicrobium sp.]|jgi:hypothetical protein|nr:DUF3572 domain-containing protein [Rhizomicrobium sp.]